MRWSPNGDKICIMKKTGFIHFDPRSLDVIARASCHLGPKSQKVAWIDNEKFITSGFAKTSEREFCIWDSRNTTEPVSRGLLGDGNGVGHLYYDEQHNLLHVAGRGEMDIKMFELDKSSTSAPLKPKDSYVGLTPQKGFMMMEKPCLDVNFHEVNRGIRLTNNGFAEFISFRLPNKTGAY